MISAVVECCGTFNQLPFPCLKRLSGGLVFRRWFESQNCSMLCTLTLGGFSVRETCPTRHCACHVFAPVHFHVQNAPPGRTTGPLVEDGMSKKDRQEYLKKQREERKANRKNSRPRSVEPSAIRNRRTSAPAMMPSAVSGPSGFTAPGTLASPPCEAPGTNKLDSVQEPPKPIIEGNGIAESPGTGEQGVGTAVPLDQPDSSGEGIVAPPAAVRPPPPFFNPTVVPPPVAPPSTTASSHAQPPRHPSMAFNVNETVEKALTEARRDACVAERSAAFWKCRFRDLVVWSASFVVLAYASDHGFEDC